MNIGTPVLVNQIVDDVLDVGLARRGHPFGVIRALDVMRCACGRAADHPPYIDCYRPCCPLRALSDFQRRRGAQLRAERP